MLNFFKQLFTPPPTISVSQAQEKLKGKNKAFLLDVRQASEYKAGHAPGAKLIPLHELRSRLSDLPQNREILVICASGNRSRRATHQLNNAGFNAFNISGGLYAWQRAGFPVKRKK